MEKDLRLERDQREVADSKVRELTRQNEQNLAQIGDLQEQKAKLTRGLSDAAHELERARKDARQKQLDLAAKKEILTL